MKKFIKLGILTMSFIGLAFLAACDEEPEEPVVELPNPLEDVVDYSQYPEIDMEAIEQEETTLQGISFDTTNAKTHYYVGEKFTTEGLIVHANYSKFVDGYFETTKVEINDYFYDLDKLDLNTAGQYKVEFTYRRTNRVITNELDIIVTPSYLADLNVEYLAGLEPTETVFEVAKNSTFDPKTNVTLVKKFVKGNALNLEETKEEAMTTDEIANVVVETTLDTTKTGKYVVKYTYDTSVAREDGSIYEYKVASFVVVVVK